MTDSDSHDLAVETTALARILAQNRRDLIEFYLREYQLPPQQAIAKATEWDDAEWEKRILSLSPDRLWWSHLNTLADANPEKMLERWSRIKEYAREELTHGITVAKSVVGRDDTPVGRAEFAAILAAFMEQWNPTNEGERLLVQMLAQQYAGYLFWSEYVQVRATSEPLVERSGRFQREGVWKPPRVSESQAIEQGAAMQSKYHALFCRTMRMLTNLRRLAPSMVITNSQVNVGVEVSAAQQLNPAHPGPGGNSGGE